MLKRQICYDTHTEHTHTHKEHTHTHGTHTHTEHKFVTTRTQNTHTHTHRTQICYRLQFQDPTVNLSALCNWCVKIACRSSQLIFTFLYAASSSIQNASERAICLVQPPSLRKFRPSSNPTKTIKLRCKPHCLANQSEPATCCSVH